MSIMNVSFILYIIYYYIACKDKLQYYFFNFFPFLRFSLEKEKLAKETARGANMANRDIFVARFSKVLAGTL